jgi:PAS domain S-box-containing protein
MVKQKQPPPQPGKSFLIDAFSVLREMPVALLATDAAGTVQFANNRACKLFGYSAQDIVGLSIRQLVPNLSGRSSANTAKSENDGRRHDGTVFPARLYTKNVDTTEGSSFLVAVEDLSAEYEVARLKRQFVAMISHDLRTPLTAVALTVRLLSEGVYGTLQKEAAEKVDSMLPLLGGVDKLVEDLLLVEKLSSGTFHLEVGRVHLEDIMESSMLAVVDRAEDKGISLMFDNAFPRKVPVIADADRIVQVVINLLTNAIRYSRNTETIFIKSQLDDKVVRISVTDSGPGVPDHAKSDIFEPFKQVDAVRDTKSGGTGLGLAICKAIVEQHGGKIGVVTPPGGGSEFWFTLPVAESSG